MKSDAAGRGGPVFVLTFDTAGARAGGAWPPPGLEDSLPPRGPGALTWPVMERELEGGGRTVACAICHGADLRGMGPVPALAGRSPTYMARQLYDLQQKNRDGAWSDLMDRVVRDLTIEDIVAIVAYTASLDP